MAYLKRNSRSGPAPGLFLAILAIGSACHAATLQLNDGRIISGKLGETAGVAEDPIAPGPSAGAIRTTPILVIEDGLRRAYVHKTAVREVLDERDEPRIRIPVWQNPAKRGASLGSIGAPSSMTPFDEYGRRIIELPSDKGPIAVIQGVTEVTPVYTRVQGLKAEPRSYLWDMRLATSSLPRQTLTNILHGAIPRNDFDARMQVVRLYLQSERYRDASEELKTIQADFAGSPEASLPDLEDNLRRLRGLAARSLLDEIELRRDAGQHALARTFLERFPDEGVTGDTLQRVRELLDEDDAQRARHETLLARLDGVTTQLGEPAAKRVAERIVAEIRARLTPATADRLTAFTQLASGDALSSNELAAVAISGWLLGSNNADESLPAALSLVRTRDAIRRYLATGNPQERAAALNTLRDAEGAEVSRVAELLARMEPPLPLVDPPDASMTDGEIEASPPLPVGCYELTTEVGERTIRSLVQLPPEYDPLRSYPTILTLGDLGVSPDRQLDYWAGSPRAEVGRLGQARRRGYVVIAIDWATPDQLRYGYRAEEHAAVLSSLRNAMRRVAIDSDRVFLTGHGAGGDLAWDLALAHPEHWAGCLPFLAVADRYCDRYWRNAEFVPWRVVLGELDAGKLDRNARELDRYLRPRYDATVVEYRGRGYDPLSDDIQRTFDWMGRKRRGAPPEEFECNTMRPWDNYFWWIEAEGLPQKSITLPAQWPPRRGSRPASIRGRKYTGNKLAIFCGAEKVTVWLSPELVDFDQPIEIEHNGRRLVPRGERVTPDLGVLLEDARTRADRKRPYWAKVESR
ncbi:hypothetical protein MalM25_29090 [Planctomycetes bacterium MalM25]|nr:hypothetical protein MalM25_29090 [Planctomycetes bacterium MalM25]